MVEEDFFIFRPWGIFLVSKSKFDKIPEKDCSSMNGRIENRAFTLLELLVVISIIALLTGILVPSISKVRAMAKSTVCKSNLHAAAAGFRMYLDEYDDLMPPAARYPSLEINDKKPIAEFLEPFMGGPKSLLCPADDGHKRDDYTVRYYESEGSSYEYQEALGGKRVDETYLTNEIGMSERNVHVIYDYDHFHGKKDRRGSVNYLYSDGHIGDRKGN